MGGLCWGMTDDADVIDIHPVVPVHVQGELVQGSSMIVTALMAAVAKFGKDGLLEISQTDALNLLQGRKEVEITYDFARDVLQIWAR
jgi:hypothetical protein